MKTVWLIVLSSLIVKCTLSVLLESSSCPLPRYPPDFVHFGFSDYIGLWYEMGRTDETEPRTVYNTIEINHLYPGQAYVLFKGDTRDPETKSQWDSRVELYHGHFDGNLSYYDYQMEPFFFQVQDSAGKQTDFWVPYYNQPDSDFADCLLFSCIKINDTTIDAKAWYLSRKEASAYKPISQEIDDIVVGMTTQKLTPTCQRSDALC